MNEPRVVVRVVLLIAAAVVLAVAASKVRDKRGLALATVDDIEAQLVALDPATRAAVLARLATDAGRAVQNKHTKA